VTQGRGGEHGARFGTDRRSTVTKPLRRSLPAVPASVPVLRAAVAEFVAAVGVSEAQLAAVKLAVSEAVTNAVMHAYLDADEPGEVRVVTCLRGATVYVTVSDDGVGMMPRLDSPGLGVGLPFIADTADTLDIDSTEGGGTELRMSFRLAGGQLPAP
jgi:anti-sigma regulatory factor (Ser/Thr protein kinase)